MQVESRKGVCVFIHPITQYNGLLFAFEVRSGYMSFWGLCRCISRMAGIEMKERHVSPFAPEDNYAEFIFEGGEFVIDTPFSDHWVGPKYTRRRPEIQQIMEYVEQHGITIVRRKFFDLLTLDFKSALGLDKRA
jgi:hypothetical protein